MQLIDELDLYDPLQDKPTLNLYLVKKGQNWVPIQSEELVIGKQMTRILQSSQDHRPLLKRQVQSGERLSYHVKKEGSPWRTFTVVPSEWIVVEVFKYEANLSNIEGELPEFREVQIAYCDRCPLSTEEIECMSYEIISKVSIDSFGGDKEAYKRFLETEESKKYVHT